MEIMASLMRSAAVPCSGVLMAVRSANPRWLGLRLSMSGMGRMRPKSVRTLPLRRTSSSVLSMNCFDAFVAREVALDIGLGLSLRNAQLRGEAEGRDSVDDAEVDGLGAVARFLVHGVDGHAEDFARGERVDVDVFFVGAHQQRIAAEVRQQAQLDLRVVGREQLRAGRGGECGTNFAAELGANGNVLEIGIDGGEPAGGGGGCLEGGVDARIGVGKQRQSVDVIRFELGQVAVFEDQSGDFVLLGELFEHVLRGGDGFCLCRGLRARPGPCA